MSEHIATINEFLSRGELRLNRDGDIYQILYVYGDGRAQAYRNPHNERREMLIMLTEEEIASLASLSFPPTRQAQEEGG